MPRINESLIQNLNTEGLSPIPAPPPESLEPMVRRAMFVRSPVPQITNVSHDTASQGYLGPATPQYRVWVRNS